MDLEGPGRDVQVGRTSPYPEEFRRDAVELYRAAGGKRTYAAVAADLGITGETLRTWVRKDTAQPAPERRDDGSGPDPADELARRLETAQCPRRVILPGPQTRVAPRTALGLEGTHEARAVPLAVVLQPASASLRSRLPHTDRVRTAADHITYAVTRCMKPGVHSQGSTSGLRNGGIPLSIPPDSGPGITPPHPPTRTSAFRFTHRLGRILVKSYGVGPQPPASALCAEHAHSDRVRTPTITCGLKPSQPAPQNPGHIKGLHRTRGSSRRPTWHAGPATPPSPTTSACRRLRRVTATSRS